MVPDLPVSVLSEAVKSVCSSNACRVYVKIYANRGLNNEYMYI